jgi:hypothetical protein
VHAGGELVDLDLVDAGDFAMMHPTAVMVSQSALMMAAGASPLCLRR